MTKKNCLFFAFLCTLTLGFFGCQKIEQTELNIDDSQYSTTIQGTLLYPAGVTATDAGGTPVAGKTVFVDVPYSYYSSTATGTKRFTTTTDNQGKFSIKVPAKIASGTAIVTVESFHGKHYIFEQYVQDGSNYVPKFVEKEVIYQFGGIPVTITASSIENKNLILAYDLVGAKPEFLFTANYKFNVEKIYYALTEAAPYSTSTKWIPQANTNVIVTITRGADDYVYLGKSNSDGTVSVDIPIKAIEETVWITVTANPFRGNLTFYEIATDLLSYTTVNKTGVFSTSGYDTYCTLKALQAVTATQKVRFTFTAD